MLAIGIDIGGTYTKVGIVEAEKGCLYKTQFRTTDYTRPRDYLEKIVEEVENLDQIFSVVSIKGVGIGAPGVDERSNQILAPENISWLKGFDLAGELEVALRKEVRLINDANACALGEYRYGAAKGMSDFILITLGTGLGGAIFVNGQLLIGVNGLAGEIGHVTAVENGRMCNCGKRGCLETYASATGIRRTAFEIMSDSTDLSPLREVPFNELEAKAITDAALSMDPIAVVTFLETGRILGASLANLVAVFDPQVILLSGGLAQAGDCLFLPTRNAMKDNLISSFPKTVEVKYTAFDGASAAIMGAASLFLDKLVLHES